jgi:hypothetical protein
MKMFKYVFEYESEFVGWTVSPNVEYLEVFLLDKDAEAARAKCLSQYFEGYGTEKLAQIEKCLRMHKELRVDKSLAIQRSRAVHEAWARQLDELEQ